VSTFRSQQGYTVVELIVAMGIFAVVLVTALGSFLSVSSSANKAGAQRKVQQDVRFNIEEIARQSRSSSVNYDFYRKNDRNACGLAATGASNVLALNYTTGDGVRETTQHVFYVTLPELGTGTSKLYRYVVAGEVQPTCDIVRTVDNEHQAVTADQLEVRESTFLISPTADPNRDTVTPGNSAKEAIHPRVTIALSVKTIGTPETSTQQSRSSDITIQTTVSTRVYAITPNEVGAAGP